MKSSAWPIVLGLTLLVGCQNNVPKEETRTSTEQNQQISSTKNDTNTPFPYPNLLSESDQSFSLLVIGDQDNHIESNSKITGKVKDILSLPDLDLAKKAYPELKMKTEPTYILFDQAGVLHQSDDFKELTTYLEQNTPQ